MEQPPTGRLNDRFVANLLNMHQRDSSQDRWRDDQGRWRDNQNRLLTPAEISFALPIR